MRAGLAAEFGPGIVVVGSGTALVMMEPGIVAVVAGLGTGLVVVVEVGIDLVRVGLDIVVVGQAGMGPGSLDLVGQVESTFRFASASVDGHPGMLRTRSSSSRGSSPRASRILCIRCVV